MIRAEASPAPAQQQRRLADKARALALAHLVRTRDAARAWRSPSALWPLFERK
ncbi:hypothetical protein LY632_01665 [Erythrobacter sp. SDW2]|uniref:hypothetical protein n=1 Tax=Erythrobacter sp. SDW2 TaxID=2907154 RepID=UPI001F38E86B|nr:hypothetical protein [Erythrobacter sp. SDW2]UIP07135.1 hypothetical protein LY632_01665 [Erythrobacter sp. SDW2]